MEMEEYKRRKRENGIYGKNEFRWEKGESEY